MEPSLEPSNAAPGIIGDYQLETKLGKDRALEVWRARHGQQGTLAVVKFLNSQSAANSELQERLFNEARRRQTLNHPQLVSITDVLRDGQRVFVVTRYVDGMLLEDLLARDQRPLPVNDAIRISRDILSALSYAHVNGVVHKDLNPWNIVLDARGQAYVDDFGLSLAIAARGVTRSGRALGSSYYMSPEQILRPSQVDLRSDIYSFGCVLYEMLTGRMPFAGGSEYEVMNQHVQQAPAPPSRPEGPIPRGLQYIAMRALAKRPDDRFASCLEILDLLNRLQDDTQFPAWTDPSFRPAGAPAVEKPALPPSPPQPAPLAPIPPAPPKARLNPVIIGAVVAVLATGAVFIERSLGSKASISSTATNGTNTSEASIPPAPTTSGSFAPIPPPPPVDSGTPASPPSPAPVASPETPAAAPEPPVTAPAPVAVPASTTPPATFNGLAFRVRLTSSANTETSETGDPLAARVIEPAQFRNWTLTGTIVASKKKNLLRRHAELVFSFQTLENPRTGEKIPVTSSVTSYANAKGESDIDDDGNEVAERKNEPPKSAAGPMVSTIAAKANSVSLKKGGVLGLSVSTRAE